MPCRRRSGSNRYLELHVDACAFWVDIHVFAQVSSMIIIPLCEYTSLKGLDDGKFCEVTVLSQISASMIEKTVKM